MAALTRVSQRVACMPLGDAVMEPVDRLSLHVLAAHEPNVALCWHSPAGNDWLVHAACAVWMPPASPFDRVLSSLPGEARCWRCHALMSRPANSEKGIVWTS